jgi:hypothetical protein
MRPGLSVRNCVEASIRWTRSRAWPPHFKKDKGLRASLYGLLASTRYRLTMNLATNQRAQKRDRTNVSMCHLDHLLQLPWARALARAAHHSRAPYTETDRNCGVCEDFKPLGGGQV